MPSKVVVRKCGRSGVLKRPPVVGHRGRASKGTKPMCKHNDDDKNGADSQLTTDGGVVVAHEAVEILDDTAPDEDDGAHDWAGPFTEYDKYGEPTGAKYVRCRDCGVEVLAHGKDNVDDCRR